ncbi:MAG TPA: hypothetical protein VFM23_08130 [Gemmatimonadales bacterium]|nr:hypothetical protein [Gemmatimonadales bacterium]
MRKLFGGMLLAAVALTLPATVDAQRRAAPPGGARHELGVDVGVAYVKPDGVDGGIVIQTPLDVRVGFVNAGKMMWEPRLTFNFSSVGGNTSYFIQPGVNVLFSNTTGGHRRGMYFTGGGGLLLADAGGGSGTAFSFNAGVGWRKPSGSAALRYEVGFQWTSESTDLGLPSTIMLGGRIGLSLWK